VRISELTIVALVALNGYLIYTVLTAPALSPSAAPPQDVEIDPSVFQIQVEVLNGCGVPGLGQLATKYLRERGFDVVYISNADHFNYMETVILDRQRSGGPSEAALAVGVAIGTENVIMQSNEERLVDVSVIVGKDFRTMRFYEEND